MLFRSYSFPRPPANILSGKVVSPRITPDHEKQKILSELHIDALYLEDFEQVRNLSPEEFVKNILGKKLRARHLICGFNFTFGCNGEGNADSLTELAAHYGMTVTVIPPVICGEILVSSGYIRHLIQKGDMESASLYLGRPFFINVPVVEGRKLGRTIGIPTINQLFPDENVIPRHGVYACTCDIDGDLYLGVSNVGVRPTVTGNFNGPTVCETHILNYLGMLYGRNVKVSFYKRLRDEVQFTSLDELKSTVMQDIEKVRDYFNLYY